MTPKRKTLLVVEVVVCFAPMAIQLFLGVLIAPLQIFFLFTGEPNAKLGALLAISLVAVGLCGTAGLLHVMNWLLNRTVSALPPRAVVVLVGIGLAPLVGLAFFVTNWFGALVVIPPLLCSVHLIWLARDYLFRTPVTIT